jgi:hypothetical protein
MSEKNNKWKSWWVEKLGVFPKWFKCYGKGSNQSL